MSSFANTSSAPAAQPSLAASPDEGEGQASTDNVAHLLEEHAGEISKLARLVQSKLPADRTDGLFAKYDDIFFLRFVLSFGSADKAQAAVEECLEFRAKPRWRALIQQIRDETYEDNGFVQEMKRWQVAAPMEGITVSGGFCVVIRGGMSDQATMLDRVPTKDMYTANMAYREMAFQKCDAVTRETGVLAKQVLFFDMNGSKLSDMMDKRMSNMYAEISRLSAAVYPQLQEKMCLVNAPTWMGWVMAIFKKLLPTRTMEKFEMYTSAEAMWSSEWAASRLVRERAPAFMGGLLEDEALPEELTGACRSYAPSPEITVSARSEEVVLVDVPVGPASIKYNLVVVARGVNFSATFIEGDAAGEVQCKVAKAGVEPIVLRKESKLKADAGSCVGTWHVDKPGVVRVVFDNSYSLLRSKTVKYTLDVVEFKDGAAAAAAAKWRDTAVENAMAAEAAVATGGVMIPPVTLL